MPRYKSKKVSKLCGAGLVVPYEEDPEATKINKSNEAVLVKEITKIIKKNKSKPIDTSKLLK